MWEKIDYFFVEELWNFPLREKTGWRYSFYKWLRIVYLSVRGFSQDRCSVNASSLTYYALMSLVPVLAMAFAIAKGFGYDDLLRTEILEQFPEHNKILTELFSFSQKLLDETKGGLIAGIGLVLLFWSITQLLSSMEDILNQIWKVKKMRSWRRILSDYFAFMILAPVFFILASSTTVFVVKFLDQLIHASGVNGAIGSVLLFCIHLLPYGLFWIFFSFVYLFMPNTQVHFRSAFLGGLVAGSLYVILQWVYIYFQVGVSRYGAIYGSMAALPLFLIWIQLSWFLLLLGAEISYAHQTLEEHEFEERATQISYSFRKLLSLWLVHLVVTRFSKGESPLSREMLVKRYQIPSALAVPLIRDLVESGILIEVGEGYIPAKPLDQLRIYDVISALESKGVCEFPFVQSKTLAPFERYLNHFRSQIEALPENKRLYELSDPL